MAGQVRHQATRGGRRKALGLLLACSALTLPAIAAAQSLFSTSDSPLPALPSSQYGTPGTSTLTQNNTAIGVGTPGYDVLGTGQTDGSTNQQATGQQSLSQQAAAQLAAQAQDNPSTAIEPNGAAQDDLNQSYEQPIDDGAQPIDQQEAPRAPGDPTGVRLGTFMLRPSISQGINTETTRGNGYKQTRDYLTTGIRGTLSSDWSRHALTVSGETTFEHDFSGNDQQKRDPEGRLDADLRLDLSDDTTAHIKGAYSFTREDNDDPNAVNDADVQSGVHEYDGSASIERDLGKIRALAAVDASRYTYTDAKLADGSVLNMTDRNRTSIDGRLRLGYELSAAVIPFVEIATGHTYYDRKTDIYGYQRSSQSYAARTGLEFDLGDKLRGEIATGYENVDYNDDRLGSIGAVTFDGNATWSPHRGTDVTFGLRTTVQDSTTPGENGWTEYQLSAALAHEMRDNLVARLTGGAIFRNFDTDSEDDVTWQTGAGLTWSINRYLDMTADLEYERTTGNTASQQNVLRGGVGLTLKR